ncbi:hypothetical protein GN330_16675 [Nitratireductor sp. CAU 1489]|uniref:Uncharacterized protein n=1 Tax=Nitratireductor arenosus TaxID=2682096 RepID=A0A844QJW2_9HYPH|nr:hypothetical protein [Nitratireductor arenosus]MVA98884.1 hypothetical protein [Nitratireductor arenosus]
MASRVARPVTAFSEDPSGKDQKRIVDERHLSFIRSLPSIISGAGPCEACHIRYGDPLYRKKSTGKAQKPDDAWAVPMTPEEHRAQHAMSEVQFWNMHRIDPLAVARDLYAHTGDREAAVKIIANARKTK